MSPLFLIIPVVLLLILAGWIAYLEARLKKFFKGSSGKDLESILVSVKEELSRMKAKEEEQEKELSAMESKIKKSVQHVQTMRFNPFDDSGSNQSFAVAILNEEGTGVAISSLYSRDKVGIYAKPIEKYQSEFSLSEEEKAVITKAKNDN